MQLQIADHSQGFVAAENVIGAMDGERSDFLEIDHTASLVPAGITPGLCAVRLGGGSGASLKIVNLRDAMLEQPSDRLIAGREVRARPHILLCLHRRHDRRAKDCGAHASERGVDSWAAGKMMEDEASPRTILCGLPLFHANGQLVTGLQPWMRGDHVVLATPEGYRAKNVIARFWEIVARFRVAWFSGVPTLYAALLDTPAGDNDLSSLEFAICGAAPMPAALIWAFEGKTGVKIIEGYGLTEGAAFPQSTRQAANGSRVPSVCPSLISGWPPSC